MYESKTAMDKALKNRAVSSETGTGKKKSGTGNTDSDKRIHLKWIKNENFYKTTR